MDDLVKRVRRISIGSELGATTRDRTTAQEAADRIEALEAALRAVVTNWECPTYGCKEDRLSNVFDAVELARAALGEKKDG